MTRVIAIDAALPQPDRILAAAAVLRDGRLVAFPTETVYGLGANARDSAAVARLFIAKGRPSTDPLIVHVADAAQVAEVAHDVPAIVRDLAATFWPGPLTLILAKDPAIPDTVTAGLPTIAVRVPAHPIARALLAAARIPVAAPSANRFSRPSPTRAEHVLADLDGLIDMVIDGGDATIGVESTILDLTVEPPVIRRPGGISAEQIAALIPQVRTLAETRTSDEPQPAPGQLLRHYAPRATLTLYVGEEDALAARVATDVRAAVAAGHRVGVIAPEEDLLVLAPRLAAVAGHGRVVTMRCGSRRDRDQAARDLFGVLRAVDAAGVDVIYALTPSGLGIDAAIVDRLTRAAEGRVIEVR